MSFPLLTLIAIITASWEADKLDPSDLDATFATVFAKLPAEVTVYPSENYYYWQIKTTDGTTTWGNLRLSAKRRDRGELSFAAGSADKIFGQEHGVRIEHIEDLKYALTFDRKRVLFHLNPLVQDPPKKFALRPGEQFVQRTYDESGLQFILLYNQRFKDFIWVLNEEDGVRVPERFGENGAASIGKRSGFIFWDEGDRKILAAVSSANIRANNYYDGPFDQLADNYTRKTGLKKFLCLRDPDLADQIDQYGNYKNRSPVTRVALTNYMKYNTVEEALAFVRKALASQDPHQQISRGKRGIHERQTTQDRPAQTD